MSYQTQAAIGPYPVNCLLQAFLLALALAGILPAPLSTWRLCHLSTLSICRLLSSFGCHRSGFDGIYYQSGCRWLVTPLLSSIPDVVIVSGSRDTFDLFILLL
jgi:hypothetical protein